MDTEASVIGDDRNPSGDSNSHSGAVKDTGLPALFVTVSTTVIRPDESAANDAWST